MSAPAPTEQPGNSDRRTIVISLIAIFISLVSLTINVSTMWTSHTDPYTSYKEPRSDRMVAPQPAEKAVKRAQLELMRFLTKGAADIKKWRLEQHFSKSAESANIALAYLCIAEPTIAGRYYAASQVDTDQFFGLSPYAERAGSPRESARRLCPATPQWAQ